MSEPLFFAVLASALIHAAWNIEAKRASGNLAVLWLAQVLASLALAPWALWHLRGFDPTPRALLFISLCGLTQAIYFGLLSKAYELGDLSVVYPIARGLGVAGAALASALLLDEELSPLGLAGVATIGLGTVLLGVRGLAVGAMAPLLYSGAIGLVLTAGATTDKLAVSLIHPVLYIFFMFFLASGLAAPFVLRRSRAQVAEALRARRRTICIVALGSMGSYLIVLFAFREGPLAYIAAIRESSVLLGTLFGYVVLKERFTLRRGLGMAMILTGLVLVRLA